ncbi:hypothetical protein JCM3770_002309 [Rhodotorula araucariae]
MPAQPPAPPPVPPRRPPPAARSSSSAAPSLPVPSAPSPSASFERSANPPMPSTSSLLRSRALAKVGRLASHTQTYVAPRLESAAGAAAGKLASLREAYTSRDDRDRDRQSESAWDAPVESRLLATPKKALNKVRAAGADLAELPALAAAVHAGGLPPGGLTASMPPSPSESRSSRWAGLGSYFSTSAPSASTSGGASTGPGGASGGKGKGKALTYDEVDEDKVVCFPGYATLQPAPHDASEPALVLDVLTHGYAYRQRPLSQASRSQRIFYALAKSFAALPKIPATVAQEAGLDPTAVGNQSADSLNSSLREVAMKDGEVFEQLLEVGGRDGAKATTDELAEATVEVVANSPTTSEPEEMTLEERLRSPTAQDFASAQSRAPPSPNAKPSHLPRPPHHSSTAPPSASSSGAPRSPDDQKILDRPAKLNRRPHVRIDIPTKRAGGGARTPSLPASPTGAPGTPGLRNTAFAFTSTKTRESRSVASTPSHSRAPSAGSSRASSRASSPVRSAAASSTLPPETWPDPFVITSSTDLARLHTNLHARLLPFFGQKLPGRKVRLSVYPALGSGQLWDGALATKVVSTTGAGAGWRTTLQVRGAPLRRWLEVVGASGPGAVGGAGGGIEALRVRVTAELLEPDGASAVDSWPAGVGTGAGPNVAGYAQARATAEDECEIAVAIQGEGGEGGGVRVVSDVDDTIKWTEVVKGTRSIFRNVFVRELYEIRVPGMAAWYQAMEKEGAHMHYVSNSPVELWPVLRAFLALAGFPSGSCTLKEYGGASSALAKLWEEPGQRKRANVEMILKEFPESQFLLIGDSGEQDLELYVSLAQQYPRNILAIYIRDVTTPFNPPRAPSASSSTNSTSSRAAGPPPEVRWGHSHSAVDLASLIDEERSAAAPSPVVETAPFNEMPDLPGQFDGSHARPLVARRNSGSEAAPLAAPPLPPRPDGHVRMRSSAAGGGGGRGGGSSTASSSRTTSPVRSSTLVSSTSSAIGPDFLTDESADALSPNNPLRPSPPPSRAELGSLAAVEAFYKRVAEAERALPDGIVLRLFRHGNECAKEGVELVKNGRRR